jgi:hypothetical protein
MKRIEKTITALAMFLGQAIYVLEATTTTALQLPHRNNRCAVRACPRRIKMEAARHYNNPLAACPVCFVD